MKLTELIEEANRIRDELGDLEVAIGGLEEFPVYTYVIPDPPRFVVTLKEEEPDNDPLY